MTLSTFIEFCNHHHNPVLEHFHHLPKFPCADLQYISEPNPRPRKSLIYFLCLQICLFWTFHINGVIPYVVFCVWFLLLTILFLRFIQVEAGIRASFFSMAKPYSVVFCLSTHPLIDRWAVSTSQLLQTNSAAANSHICVFV